MWRLELLAVVVFDEVLMAVCLVAAAEDEVAVEDDGGQPRACEGLGCPEHWHTQINSKSQECECVPDVQG